MQFKASDIVTGDIEAVFHMLSDVSYFERMALARGLQVQRLDVLPAAAPGMKWRVPFRARGRDRVAEVELVKMTAPTLLRYEGRVKGLLFESDVHCRVADSDATEITLQTKLRARSLKAQVLIQSMKLARPSLNKRYRTRVQEVIRQIEDRLHSEEAR